MNAAVVEFSMTDERFYGETLGELIHSFGLNAGDRVYRGTRVDVSYEELVDVDSVIEGISEFAYNDIAGDAAEDYLRGVSKEARAELEGLIVDWLRKHAPIDFYHVENLEQYVITQADIDACATSPSSQSEAAA